MVFTVLLDFAEFLKSEIFSGAVIGPTSFRSAFLIGPVFSRFIDWECVYNKQFGCHLWKMHCNNLIIGALRGKVPFNHLFFRRL
jgi:hypothetical protein